MPKQKTTVKDIDKLHIEQHGKTFHATLSPGVRGYIDSANIDKNNNISIKGWIFHESQTIKNIRIANLSEDAEKKVIRISRPDVSNFYAPLKLDKVGFEISISKATNLKVGDQLILQCNTTTKKHLLTF